MREQERNAQVQMPGERPLEYRGPVLLVNTFIPKPGKLDEFIEVQSAEAKAD